MPPRLLETRSLCVGYDSVPVVRDLDLHVDAGEVVALLGANGAGKTTTLLALSGDLPASGGELLVDGRPTKAPLHRRARTGTALVTEERAVFMGLSTSANLRLGRGDAAVSYRLFPELKRRAKVRAGLLSGGEQQMLALGRALSRSPRLLLADELSLGLAPLVVGRLLRAVRAAADDGVGVVLVEQHVQRVLEIADRVYVLHRGRTVLTGTSSEVRADLSDITEAYVPSGAALQGDSV